MPRRKNINPLGNTSLLDLDLESSVLPSERPSAVEFSAPASSQRRRGRPRKSESGALTSPLVEPSSSSSNAINFSELERSFRSFLPHVTIFSKDLGRVGLNLFNAQDYFLRELFDGLSNDIHWFVCGKGRQLGVTTICLLLDAFWCGVVPDVQGAVVFDTRENLDKFRILLEDMLEHLPKQWKLPTRQFNRNNIVFQNGNMLDFLTAGIQRGRSTLGRSRALNFVHATELCSYGDPDAFEAFKDTLSDQFPARCYLFESTARGLGLFAELWEDAVEDTISKKAIFLGWWRKETNRYKKGTKLFQRYGYEEMSKDEQEWTGEVKRLYGVELSLEQWAWFRHRADPRASSEWTADENSDKMEIIHQENPTTPDLMFRLTGSQFFSGASLKRAAETASKHPFKGYHYFIGEDITAVRLEQMHAGLLRQMQLRIWEDPVPGAVYVLAADPAYASGDESDFFVIEVCRVYSDRIIQVAEFCERNMEHYQFAWIMCHLANYYGRCRIILDVNGPGEAVLGEFRHLKQNLESGHFDMLISQTADREAIAAVQDRNRQFRNFLTNVRDYLFHRFDSFGSGYNLQWKSSAQLQSSMMIQFRDQFMLGVLEVRSHEALGQMRRLIQEGMHVEAEGRAKKDRAVALAMAVRAWIDTERRELIASGRSFEAENQLNEIEETTTIDRYMQRAFLDSMAYKQSQRERVAKIVRRPSWKTGVWGRRSGR